ncbi:MAG: alpha/beta hydrolase [Polyangiaceae bacterium]|nr:alpha/beta hydrolase [Polyangiaceae bacterium]
MLLVPLAERFARRALKARGIESRFVQSNVAEHHIYDAQNPAAKHDNPTNPTLLPTIVFLHGISSSAAVFARTMARLQSRTKRILAIEAPGHGLSGQPKVDLTPEVLFESMAEVLIRELNEPAIVCGNSLGGAVAVSFAIRHPEWVRGLFLTSPAGAQMDPDAFKGFLEVFNFHSNGEARAFMRRIYHRPPWYAPLVAPELRQMFARKAVRDVLTGAHATRLFAPEDIRHLPMPIHLLWGKQDKLMPRENFLFYKDSLPSHAVIEEPDNVGHCPHFDDPQGYLDGIVRFARSISTR